ncbi:tetratricopeptide repeat protein [Nonlabens ponticola]|uniref:Tetratricopeptide repeat protein n=1 Tax=Nonlabens ponticola TaxID=2496866 RepID=A0A3S9MV70_9FLAO|nr:tetratricopeptide repeat protein [Nonlabens ponticola]AZQ43068.1 tetratricopeptide repeat protein [Nonlabens ponticola]
MRNLFMILLLIPALLFSQEDVDDSAFAKANNAYTNGNYQEAQELYSSILQSGKHSVQVYYNLGNTYYKLNEVAPSIYHYEKALMMDPDNEDVRNNLKFAQQMTVDRIESLGGNPFLDAMTSLVKSMSTDSWAYLSIMLAILAVLCFVLYHYAATSGKKRLFFTFFIVFLLVMGLSIYAAFRSNDLMVSSNTAIIYDQEVISRSEPNNSSQSTFTLHAGTKVEILESYEDWSKVRIANGEKAWVPQDSYKEL